MTIPTSHLPLTLGEYTTADGFTATIVRMGNHGKWAFDDDGAKWDVKTGKHWRADEFDITGRVEPAVGETVTINWSPEPLMSKADEKAASKAPRECWMVNLYGGGFGFCQATTDPSAIRMIEAAPIEAELARVTAALEHWRQEVGKLHSQVDRLKHDRDVGATDYCALMGRHDALQVELARVTAERDEAVALLREFLHAACGETGFANAVRDASGFSYPWPSLEAIDIKAQIFLAKIGAKP
jgi:hypothetical protein